MITHNILFYGDQTMAVLTEKKHSPKAFIKQKKFAANVIENQYREATCT